MNNTGIPQWVFQGICLISSWFMGDILQPVKIVPYVKQPCVRQPVIRKKYTLEKEKRSAGEDTSTTKPSIPSCVFIRAQKESHENCLSSRGEWRSCLPHLSVSDTGQVHLRIWGSEEEAGHPSTYLLSVYPLPWKKKPLFPSSSLMWLKIFL